MDVNSIGLPVTRPSPQPAPPSAEAKEIIATPDKVNNAKAELPDGVGARVDKTA